MSNTATATPVLPVTPRLDELIKLVRDNSVVVVQAETGAGKSTQVPQALIREGYQVTITQPRRLAARSVASRVAEEYGTPLGEQVGFRTAYERKSGPATRGLFVTDGLALVRELHGNNGSSVLVIDEVHEWNMNIEVLVAWVKVQVQKDPKFRVVLMSATLEADRLSYFFGGAPVMSVEGRAFPVEEREPKGRELEDDVAELIRHGHDVLVFQPGKEEIRKTIARLEQLGLNAEILPLHGELTPAEQDKCFQKYARPKCVVSSPVGQTSITVENIDAVVDSGMERRTELVDGVEGLYLMPISKADSKQRKGRAGRTKPGIFIDWCPEAWDKRPDFPKAEILRRRLDQTVLRLAEAGLDMESLEFFHQPDPSEIHAAKEALKSLGCMDDAGKVTRIGKLVAKLPISVRFARMVVEADRLGVVDDIITVAAILEQGRINARLCANCQKYPGIKSCTCWTKHAPGEKTSDVLAQLALYQAADNMKRSEMLDSGIFAKAFYQAKEKRRLLADALKGKVDAGSSGDRGSILRAICAGMVDYLYQHDYGLFRGRDGDVRELAKETVVQWRQPGQDGVSGGWIVGLPWDLHIETKRGPRTLNLIQMATAVNPAWLIDVAPHLASIKEGVNPCFDPELGEAVSTTEVWFAGHMLDSAQKVDATSPVAIQLRRDGKNLQQWQVWTRPALALPDLTDPSVGLPDIVEVEYGTDTLTGEPLPAYGVVTRNIERYYDGDPWFTVRWTRDLDEAANMMLTQRQLDDIRRQAAEALERDRQAAEIAALLQATQPLRNEVDRFLEKHRFSGELDWNTTSALQQASYQPWNLVNADGVSAWARRLEELFAAAKQALERNRHQTAALRTEAIGLRDAASTLITEHGDVFADEMYFRVEDTAVNDDELPSSIDDLRKWIVQAKAVIAEANQVVERASSPFDLSELQRRFNNHR